MSMPSEKDYRELLGALSAAKADIEATDDDRMRLEACKIALQAVMHFLLSDAEVKRQNLTQPLANVLSAVHDAGRGATVALLNHKPEGGGDKPTGLLARLCRSAPGLRP